MTEEKGDRELDAIRSIIEALNPLDELARQRVLSYVFKRLDVSIDKGSVALPIGTFPSPQPITPVAPKPVQDIRSLKEQKQPKNDSEMTAVVAFYLSEIASESERKGFVTKEDIEKYFKQARFELPEHLHMTLPHAKNAGYFDQISTGKYKLNPVGYNLVVHNLPGQVPVVSRLRSKKDVRKTISSEKKQKTVKSRKQ